MDIIVTPPAPIDITVTPTAGATGPTGPTGATGAAGASGLTGLAYINLPGNAGDYLSVPDSAELDITGDLEIVVHLAATDWSINDYRFVSKGYDTAYGFLLSNQLTLVNSFSATPEYPSSSELFSSISPVNGQAYWLKATRDETSGDVAFYWAEDQFTEPDTWTQLGTTVSGTSGPADTNTDAVLIGSADGSNEMFNGKVYRVIIRSGATTQLDLSSASVNVTGQTTITDTSANGATATVEGLAKTYVR